MFLRAAVNQFDFSYMLRHQATGPGPRLDSWGSKRRGEANDSVARGVRVPQGNQQCPDFRGRPIASSGGCTRNRTQEVYVSVPRLLAREDEKGRVLDAK